MKPVLLSQEEYSTACRAMFQAGLEREGLFGRKSLFLSLSLSLSLWLAGFELAVAASLSAHASGPLASALPQRSILLAPAGPGALSAAVSINAASSGAVWGNCGGRGRRRGDEAVQLLTLTRGQEPLVELLLHQRLEVTPLLPTNTAGKKGAINEVLFHSHSHPMSS